MNEKPCTKCGAIKPFDQFHRNRNTKDGSSCHCKTCAAEYNRQWRIANPEKEVALHRQYYETHKEQVAEKSRQWYENHPGKAAEYCRRQYSANPQRVIERTRRWQRANPETVSAINLRYREANRGKKAEDARRWRQANPERAAEKARRWRQANPLRINQLNARRRALIKGATIGDVSYPRILERDGYVCHICGGYVAPDGLQFDHIIPLSRNGTHSEDNIAVSHASCNARKWAHLSGVNV